MRQLNHRTTSTAAALVGAALLAGGCASSRSGGGTAATAESTTSHASIPAGGRYANGGGRPAATPATAHSVTATERDFSITLSRTTFTPGTYTFTVHNLGRYAHNLTIEGPAVDKVASPTTPGGGSASVTVTLQRGSYELWCSVDSHKDKGMDLTITVD